MEMLLQKTDVIISAGGNGECKLLFSVSLKLTTHQVENKYYPQRLMKKKEEQILPTEAHKKIK